MGLGLAMLVWLALGLLEPGPAVAGGAFHACVVDCRLQRRACVDDVRQAFRSARQVCADADAPRQCGRAERRRVLRSQRACKTARRACTQCCRDCLDATLLGESTCPGFGLVGVRVCSLTVCGDGRVTGDEICDDGNAIDGDGCSSDCGTGSGG
jgi:cysteine-rich repeat protein